MSSVVVNVNVSVVVHEKAGTTLHSASEAKGVLVEPALDAGEARRGGLRCTSFYLPILSMMNGLSQIHPSMDFSWTSGQDSPELLWGSPSSNSYWVKKDESE